MPLWRGREGEETSDPFCCWPPPNFSDAHRENAESDSTKLEALEMMTMVGIPYGDLGGFPISVEGRRIAA